MFSVIQPFLATASRWYATGQLREPGSTRPPPKPQGNLRCVARRPEIESTAWGFHEQVSAKGFHFDAKNQIHGTRRPPHLQCHHGRYKRVLILFWIHGLTMMEGM
jgi:hypothetical protein